MYSLCGTSVDNIGGQDCDKSRGVLKRIAIDFGSVEAADYADEQAFVDRLIVKSKLSKTDAQKLLIINEAQDLTESSDANKEGSLNLGFKTVLIEGKPSYKVKIFAGGDQLKRLRSLNNKTVKIREFDGNGTWWGTKTGTSSIGFDAKLFFTGNKIATGQNVEEGVVDFTVSILSTTQYFDNAYWVASPDGFNVDNIKGLIDVQLTAISHSSNVWKIGMFINGSNLIAPYNIYDIAGSLVAGLTFSAGTGTNYLTSLAITSVAVDATLKCLTVTFDSTAYTALAASTKIKLSGPTPAVLDTADVTDTELLPVILTK